MRPKPAMRLVFVWEGKGRLVTSGVCFLLQEMLTLHKNYQNGFGSGMEKSNLLKEAEDYFNTLKDAFIFTKKDFKKTNAVEWIQQLLAWLFTIVIVLAIYSILFEKTEHFKEIKDKLHSPGRFFLIFIIGYFLLMILLSIMSRLLYRAKKNKLLEDHPLNFCLIFDSYSAMKSYLINRRKEYMDRLFENLNIYNEITNVTLRRIEDDDPRYYSHGDPVHQINQLKQLYSWLVIAQESEIIASGLGKFPALVKRSLVSNKNVELISELIEYLLIYEYCNLVAQSNKQNKNDYESYGLQSLLEFGKIVNKQSDQFEKDESEIKKNKLIALFNTIISLFHVKIEAAKITTRLFWWWLALQIPITIIILLLVNALNVSFDGDVIAAIVGIPIAIAATLAVLDKKNENR